ncbi:MAG: hypothetical protein SF187_28965 [Deltaproteobacteria bacterium]|nr:hypothetical protein [Deltaproteobacteria bacterium]
MAVVIENFTCTIEDVTIATIASLRASARVLYTSVRLAARTRGEEPSDEQRRRWIASAYDEVISMLPESSPFRGPLMQFKESDMAHPRDITPN